MTRLIQPFVAIIARLDPHATSEVSGGGYDVVWRTVKPVDDGTQLGDSSRVEMAEIAIRCQLDRSEWGQQVLAPSGVTDVNGPILTMLWADLERLALLDSDGAPVFQVGDRVVRIERIDGVVDQTFPDPPGLFLVNFERAGHGLNAMGVPRTNLLICYTATARQSGGA
jgi:hypothetical protein